MSEKPQSCLLIFNKARLCRGYIYDVRYLRMYITPAANLTTSLWEKKEDNANFYSSSNGHFIAKVLQ